MMSLLAFCLYLMNKLREDLVKIGSLAIFRCFNPLDRFFSYFRSKNWCDSLARKDNSARPLLLSWLYLLLMSNISYHVDL